MAGDPGGHPVPPARTQPVLPTCSPRRTGTRTGNIIAYVGRGTRTISAGRKHRGRKHRAPNPAGSAPCFRALGNGGPFKLRTRGAANFHWSRPARSPGRPALATTGGSRFRERRRSGKDGRLFLSGPVVRRAEKPMSQPGIGRDEKASARKKPAGHPVQAWFRCRGTPPPDPARSGRSPKRGLIQFAIGLRSTAPAPGRPRRRSRRSSLANAAFRAWRPWGAPSSVPEVPPAGGQAGPVRLHEGETPDSRESSKTETADRGCWVHGLDSLKGGAPGLQAC